MNNRSLTPKRRAYAAACVELGSEADAYRRAYDADGMNSQSARTEACRLMKEPAVGRTIASDPCE